MIKNNGYECSDGPVCSVPDVSDPSFAVASGRSIEEYDIMFNLTLLSGCLDHVLT